VPRSSLLEATGEVCAWPVSHSGESRTRAAAFGRGRVERGHVGHLDTASTLLYVGSVDEEQGIYRGEITAMMFALADIYADTSEILAILRDEDDDDAEEEANS
jgi:hypothetical protein